MKLLFTSLILLFAYVLNGQAVAEKFYLESGAIYIGTVKEQTDEIITILTIDGNKLSIRKQDIIRIEQQKSATDQKSDSIAIPVGFIEVNAAFNGNESDIGANLYRMGFYRGIRIKSRLFLSAGGSIRAYGLNTLHGHTLISADGNFRFYHKSKDHRGFYLGFTPGVLFNITKDFRAEGHSLNLNGGWILKLINDTPFYLGATMEFYGTGVERGVLFGVSASVGI
ncbi:hypothetical protein L21SP5_03728 [Salinivirga cyanobacteriivorans]|uniref:Uncharacterized protein n=1 Tax=Salinivirga cyanobacteriivorans TaxID=1307839 RepID=A0A0S2I502_9BACT|nr:hypothetical protein [Salinivirga cyanobacteriivorans]ALO17326.1 hypothetical protein L21SP5_03728 [Salinivirga cyanobacteriivorans]